MKQDLFAYKMGVSQQYVSKLERQKHITIQKLEAAAKVLSVSVSAIQAFDERSVISSETTPKKEPGDQSIKEVMDYFIAELSKRDKRIEELQTELGEYRNSRTEQ